MELELTCLILLLAKILSSIVYLLLSITNLFTTVNYTLFAVLCDVVDRVIHRESTIVIVITSLIMSVPIMFLHNFLDHYIHIQHVFVGLAFIRR